MATQTTGFLAQNGDARRWGEVIALGIALFCLMLAGGGLPRWQSSAFLHVVALVGLAGAGGSWIWRGRSLRTRDSAPGPRVDPIALGRMHTAASASLLLLLVLLIFSSLLAEHTGSALRRLSAWVCLAAWVYLIARTAGTVERLRRWTATLALFGVLASAVGLIHWLAQGGQSPTFPFVNPNYNGALAVAALPLVAALAVSERSRWLRAGWLLCLAPLLSTLVLSRSTTAHLALVAALLTFLLGVTAWWRSGRGDAAAGATAAFLVLLSLGLPIVLGRSTLGEHAGVVGFARARTDTAQEPGLSYKSSPDVHWRRLKAVFQGDPDTAIASRLRFARSTVLALGDEPLLGYGPGSVPLTFGRYRLQVPGASEWGEAVGQLHSVGLQRLYEAGLPGLVAFSLWLLFSVLGRSSADPQRAWLRVGLAGSVGALAVAGAADALETAPIFIAFGFAVLALMASRHEARLRERLPRWALKASGFAFLLVSVLIAADWLRADIAQRRGERAVRQVRALNGVINPDAYTDLRVAAELDPVVGLYGHQAAYAAEEVGLERLRQGDRAAGQRMLEEAERLHVETVRRFPDVYGFSSQAGNFMLDRDRPHDAIPYLRKAVALDYYAPLSHFYLGEAYRLTDRDTEAIESHARAIRHYPGMARAAMWNDPDLAEFRRRVLQRVRQMLLEESASHPPESPSGELLRYVNGLLEKPQAVPGTEEPFILAHKIDEIPARARARHIFYRQGFTMINLPVRIVPESDGDEEERWTHVVDGLPSLTASGLERPERSGSSPRHPRTDTEPRPAKRSSQDYRSGSWKQGAKT